MGRPDYIQVTPRETRHWLAWEVTDEFTAPPERPLSRLVSRHPTASEAVLVAKDRAERWGIPMRAYLD